MGGVYKRGRREGLGGNNYFSIKPEGSRLAGQAAPVDISETTTTPHPAHGGGQSAAETSSQNIVIITGD